MRIRTLCVAAFCTALTLGVTAQQTKPTVRTTNAEYQLVGVRLYDTGAKVVSLYGSPDDIQGLNSSGSGSAGPDGRAGGASSGPGGGSGAQSAIFSQRPEIAGDPFGMGSVDNRQFAPGEDEAGSRDSGPGRNRPGGNAPAGGSASPDNGGGGGNDAGSRVVLTRWVYKRPTGTYGFVFDKFNRVVQIEALGISDKKVKTRKGMGFGNTVQQLIQKYGAPDAYEVGGTHIVLRFLVKDRVAFRLSRLKPNDKHRVTGVVIAAGKS